MNKKGLLTIFLIWVTIMVSLGGMAYWRFTKYKDKFVKNTYINGFDVSNLTREEVYDKIFSLTGKTLTIKDDVSKVEVLLDKFVSVNVNENILDDIWEDSNSPLSIFLGQNFGQREYWVNVDISIDETLLQSELSSFINNPNRKMGDNAYIYLDDYNGFYAIKPETLGSVIDSDILLPKVESYLSDNYSFLDENYLFDCMPHKDIYVVSDIVLDDLSDECLNINQTFDGDNFALNIYGNQLPISSQILIEWANKNDKELPIIEDGNISYDEDKIAAFVEKIAEDYDTQGKGVQLLNHNDDIIIVEDNKFGWKLDKEATFQSIVEHLYAHNNETLDVVFKNYGFPNNEIPSTYVEVDVKEQHMYFYIDGKLALESDVVTGNLGTNDTNLGVHRVLNKAPNASLMGNAFAYYWMRFDEDGEGFHDATWRSNFGGTIYQGNGSHGCVNMPLDKAKELYEILDVGTYVFVY